MDSEQEGGLQPVRTRAPMVLERRRAEKLGFRGEIGSVKSQKWPILGLKPVSRRDVRGHVAP